MPANSGSSSPRGHQVLMTTCLFTAVMLVGPSIVFGQVGPGCDGAMGLVVPAGGSVSTVGFLPLGPTPDPKAFDCGAATYTGGSGAWYDVVGTGNVLTASTCDDADFDTQIMVYLPCNDCDHLVCIAGNDTGIGCSLGTSETSWESIMGVSYKVFVTGFGGATGMFTLTLADSGTASANALDCPLVFGDLTHQALGDAVLTVVGDTLEVSNIGSSGDDGVTIDVNESREFRTEFAVEDVGGPGGSVTLTAIGQLLGVPDQELASITLASDASGVTTLASDFPAAGGGALALQVFDDDEMVAEVLGVETEVQMVACRIDGATVPDWSSIPREFLEAPFRANQSPEGHAMCSWTLQAPSDPRRMEFVVTARGDTLVGNRITITTVPPGCPPSLGEPNVAFTSAVEIRATDRDTLLLRDELALVAEPCACSPCLLTTLLTPLLPGPGNLPTSSPCFSECPPEPSTECCFLLAELLPGLPGRPRLPNSHPCFVTAGQ